MNAVSSTSQNTRSRPDRGCLTARMLPTDAPDVSSAPVELHRSADPIGYEAALEEMDRITAGIIAGTGSERVWLLEHPPLYTAGTRANADDLLDPDLLPVHRTGRGGEYTYHGPGQRIAYVMLDLGRRTRDIRCFVAALESWVIAALAHFGIAGERRGDRVGVWVQRPDRPPLADGTPAEDKIAAVGVRVRKWVTFHGISINVCPDLGHYRGIVPCGVTGHGVTSLHDLGVDATVADFDAALVAEFDPIFGPLRNVSPRP